MTINIIELLTNHHSISTTLVGFYIGSDVIVAAGRGVSLRISQNELFPVYTNINQAKPNKQNFIRNYVISNKTVNN